MTNTGDGLEKASQEVIELGTMRFNSIEEVRAQIDRLDS
jgi:hypothetical protein